MLIRILYTIEYLYTRNAEQKSVKGKNKPINNKRKKQKIPQIPADAGVLYSKMVFQ